MVASYRYNQSWHEFPPELQRQLQQALDPVAAMQRKRMFTSIPGRPNGGWPGIDHSLMVREIRDTAMPIIDKWNKDHP